MKKILLVTDIPPSQKYTAGIVLEQLCRYIPKESLLIYTAASKYVDATISPDFKDVLHKKDFKARENHFSCSRKLVPLYLMCFVYRFFKERMNAYVAKRLTKRIIKFAKPHAIDTVWCVLQGQTMVRIAEPVAKGLNAELYVQVWDALNWWLFNHHVDPFSRRFLYQIFDHTLKVADGCATASEPMSDLYTQKYGTRCVPLVYSLPKEQILPPDAAFMPRDKLVIGFAGQIYAKESLEQLVDMLEAVQWRVAEREIEIQLYGPYLDAYGQSNPRIKCLGWCEPSQLIQSLRNFDILYMPYIFNPQFTEMMMTSFPSKLVTYMAAGRPILYHGPSYASANKLLTAHRAGQCCTQLGCNNIYNALYTLITNEKKREQMVQNAHQLVLEKFTTEVQERLFKQLFYTDAQHTENKPLHNHVAEASGNMEHAA